MGMRILLADGQIGTRSALRLLLEQEEDIEVVGETGWAGDLLSQLEAAQPDVVLLDWGLPGLPNGVLLPTIRARHGGLKVIALSGRPEVARQALAAGVDVFVSKAEPPDRLLVALHDMARRNRANWRAMRGTG